VADENVQVVRDQFAATNARDFQRAMELYAQDVTMNVRGGLNPGAFEGREAVGRWFGDWLGTFEPGYHFEIHEARDLGGGGVFLLATHGGRGRVSGAEVHGETTYLYRVREGLIVRVELFFNEQEGHAAAASPEWSGAETD
jgi:ketosteroid isomerase-like protein